MSKTKEAWGLVDNLGETLTKDLHIISIETVDSEIDRYRIYHESGYCIDLERVKAFEPGDELGGVDLDNVDVAYVEPDGHVYTYYSGWDGFEKVKK